MDWLQTYGIETPERAWHLGEPATLTVVMRDLFNDARTHAFVPVEPTHAGERQKNAIQSAIAVRYPEARWKTYDEEKQVATFVDSDYLYIVIYEEHAGATADPAPAQQSLFAA